MRDDEPIRRRRRRNPWLVPLVTAGVLLSVLLPLAGFVGFAMLMKKNAACPACGHEFNIPESHRGTLAEHTRSYPCPNCGMEWPPSMLYKKKR